MSTWYAVRQKCWCSRTKCIPEQIPSPTDFTFLSDNISEKRRTTYTFLSDNTNENVLIHKRFCPTPPNSTNSITNCSRREQETASPSSLEEIERQRDMEAMAYMSSSIDGLDWDDWGEQTLSSFFIHEWTMTKTLVLLDKNVYLNEILSDRTWRNRLWALVWNVLVHKHFCIRSTNEKILVHKHFCLRPPNRINR